MFSGILPWPVRVGFGSASYHQDAAAKGGNEMALRRAGIFQGLH